MSPEAPVPPDAVGKKKSFVFIHLGVSRRKLGIIGHDGNLFHDDAACAAQRPQVPNRMTRARHCAP